MASVSMMASFVGSAAVVAQQPLANGRRTLFVAEAVAKTEGRDVATVSIDGKKGSNGLRAAMFAVAVAAVTVVAGQGMMALAEDEPKRGTFEARKKYGPICVTMPTARVCNKIA